MAWKLKKWLTNYGTVQVERDGKIVELSVKDGHEQSDPDAEKEADLIKWIEKDFPLLKVYS